MWVIVSIPIWIVSVIIFGVGIVGLVVAFDKGYGKSSKNEMKDAVEDFLLGTFLLIVSAVFAGLAAKIAT